MRIYKLLCPCAAIALIAQACSRHSGSEIYAPKWEGTAHSANVTPPINPNAIRDLGDYVTESIVPKFSTYGFNATFVDSRYDPVSRNHLDVLIYPIGRTKSPDLGGLVSELKKQSDWVVDLTDHVRITLKDKRVVEFWSTNRLYQADDGFYRIDKSPRGKPGFEEAAR